MKSKFGKPALNGDRRVEIGNWKNYWRWRIE